MTDASNMRRFLKLFEAAAPDYVGPKGSDTISYSAEQTKGEISKITATLKSYNSGRYTKLGRNLLRIETLTEEIKTLQSETKQEARELVADLFHAEDAACTRVVDTVGFMFHMSKDPKAAGSVSYSKVLDELQAHLTPELLNVLETLKAKHTSAPVQKAASLKATDKAPQTEESIVEGIGDKLTGFFKKVFQEIKAWGASYDSKLDMLKSQVQMGEGLDEVSTKTLKSYKDQADGRDTMLATNKIRAANGVEDFYSQDGRMTSKGPKVPATESDEPRGGTSDAYKAGRKAYYTFYSKSRANRPKDIAKNPYKDRQQSAEWSDGWNDMSDYGWAADDEALREDSSGYRQGDEVMINKPGSEGNGKEAHVDSYDSETGLFKVYLTGTGFHGFYTAYELKPLRLTSNPDARET